MVLSKKIDFLCVIVAEDCNPNGDPTIKGRPRIDYDGYGEMSAECIKRKIRDRLQEMGEKIFVQPQDRSDDGTNNLRDRLEKELRKKELTKEEDLSEACEKWIDVRSFGQVFAFKGNSAAESVRGPVSVGTAKSIDIIQIKEYQITRSVNSIPMPKNKKDSSTMGTKYKIDKGVYVFRGGIYPQLAQKTGFTDEDAEKIKLALLNLFENDASNARPNGSMTVGTLYWWTHKGKQGTYPPIKVFRSVEIEPTEEFPYYRISENRLDGIKTEVYNMI